MSNTINWGKIYEKTAWGIGVINNISWGKIYATLAGPIPSFALDFANIANDFTFTRNSFATRVNEFGLIETVTDLGSDLVQNGDFEELGSDLVRNGDFEELGPELVTNGDFATDSDWIKQTGWTISNGKAIGTNANGYLFQNPIVTVGVDYQITFTVSDYTSGTVKASIGNSGFGIGITANGTYTEVITASGNTIAGVYSDDSFNGSIDNVSIKQVDPNDDWDKESGWVIQNGYAESTALNTRSIYQDVGIPVIGKTYQITYTMLETNGGNFRFSYGGVNGTIRTAVGTYTENIVATSSADGNIYFDALNVMVGKIDNVSVKQIDPNDEWSLGSDWTIANGVANSSGVSGDSNLRQNGIIPLSVKKYILSYNVLTTDGNNIRLAGGNSAFGTVVLDSLTIGNNSIELTSNGTQSDLIINSIGFTGSIDNISIKEVLEDDIPRIDYTDATFDVPVLGDELIVNGDFATDSDWVKGIGWSIEDGKATHTGASSYIQQSNVYTIGEKYRVSLEITDYTSGLITLPFDANGGNIQYVSGVGIYTSEFTMNSNTCYIYANSFEGSIDNVSVKEVTAYTTTDKGAFLLEPQSTNLIPYSEDFSQWVPNGSTLNLVSGVAPDGSTSVYELTSVTAGKLQQTISGLSVNTQYTLSFYVKQTSSTTLVQSRVLSQTGGSGGSNLTSVNYQDQLVTDEWVRITHTFTTNDTLGNYIVYVSQNLTVGESLQFWGVQLEELPYTTSYIPTNGSTVTRSAESCLDATPTINSEEGVLYAEINTKTDATDKSISISDGSRNNRVWIGYSTASKRVYSLVYSGNVLQAVMFKSLVNEEDFIKVACRYKENDFSFWVNGIKEGEDTVGITPLNMNNLSFNLGGIGGNFYGRNKDLKIYDKALTDDELIELTTI